MKALAATLLALPPVAAFAHGVTGREQAFLEQNDGAKVFIYTYQARQRAARRRLLLSQRGS